MLRVENLKNSVQVIEKLLNIVLRPPEAAVAPVTLKMFLFEGWNFHAKRKGSESWRERERAAARWLKEFQHVFLQLPEVAGALVFPKMFLFN